MNGQVEVTWRILLTIAHSLMVHARVSGAGKKWAKHATKMQNESVITSFCSEILPMVAFIFKKNELLECEIKIPLGYYSVFYRHYT